MIETIPVTLWSLSDEKIFLNQVIDRCRGKSATADRFGTSAYFIEQYLAGLQLRIVNFNGTGKLEAFERAVIREYAEGLLRQREGGGLKIRPFWLPLVATPAVALP